MNEPVRSSSAYEFISFSVGNQDFCIGTTSVREIRGWTPAMALPHAPEHVIGVVNLRGLVLPIVDLSVRLGFQATTPTSRHAIIVVETGRQVVGLLVDAVSDIFTVDDQQIQPVSNIAGNARNCLHGVIAMEGRLVGAIDMANLLPFMNMAA